jgi:hypothetical protein
MCDYSLQHIASRPARVGETLTTYHFGTGTRGFHVPQEAGCAVCVLPGTELGFAHEIKYWENGMRTSTRHRTAIFRQVNKQIPHVHHDALELPDGRVLMVNHLFEGQQATVLQLPAIPRTPEELEVQTRVDIVG